MPKAVFGIRDDIHGSIGRVIVVVVVDDAQVRDPFPTPRSVSTSGAEAVGDLLRLPEAGIEELTETCLGI